MLFALSTVVAAAPTGVLADLVTLLLGFLGVFFQFALDLLLPQADPVTGAYTVTLINIVVWVPILFGLIGAAFAFAKKYLLRSRM